MVSPSVLSLAAEDGRREAVSSARGDWDAVPGEAGRRGEGMMDS
jgi:hypothetical protein